MLTSMAITFVLLKPHHAQELDMRLMKASAHGHVNKVQVLLANKADVNAKDKVCGRRL